MHYVCCMKNIIDVNTPLTELFEIFLEYDKNNDFTLKNKKESIKKCCEAICLSSPRLEVEDSATNLLKVLGNYHDTYCGLKSKTSFSQELMGSADHVPSVKRSGEYFLDEVKKPVNDIYNQAIKEGTPIDIYYDKVEEFVDGIIEDVPKLMIGIKLTQTQHKHLKNDEYLCSEQLKLLHYKDLNTVIRFFKLRKKEVKEMHQKGLGPVVFHKKFHTPQIEYIKLRNTKGNLYKTVDKKRKDEIKERYDDQDLIFYTGFFIELSKLKTDQLDKYIDEELEEIQLEPSNPEWGSYSGVNKLIEVINKDLRLPVNPSNNLINNKNEEGAPSLFSESISVFAPSSL